MPIFHPRTVPSRGEPWPRRRSEVLRGASSAFRSLLPILALTLLAGGTALAAWFVVFLAGTGLQWIG